MRLGYWARPLLLWLLAMSVWGAIYLTRVWWGPVPHWATLSMFPFALILTGVAYFDLSAAFQRFALERLGKGRDG